MAVNIVLHYIVENEKKIDEKFIEFYPHGYETIWVSRFEHFRSSGEQSATKFEK